MKNQFWDPKLTFELVSKTKMTSKYILYHSAVIPAQFPYIKICFLMKIAENRQKTIKIDILGSAAWPEALNCEKSKFLC